MNLDLETERLLIRPLQEDDVDHCVELWTDPEVMQFVRDSYPKAEVIAHMTETCDRGGGGCIGVWCVIDRVRHEKLGTAVLLPLPIDIDDTDWSLVQQPEIPNGEIEVGYLFKPAAWGKGYATETCGQLLEFAFTETPLEEIVATTDSENVASQHVLQKCGMVHEGLRRAYNCDDCSGFRIAKSDWLARR